MFKMVSFNFNILCNSKVTSAITGSLYIKKIIKFNMIYPVYVGKYSYTFKLAQELMGLEH